MEEYRERFALKRIFVWNSSCRSTQKGRGSLDSLEKFKAHNPLSKAVKRSANNLGYDEKSKTLTLPLYALFLYLDEVKRKETELGVEPR